MQPSLESVHDVLIYAHLREEDAARFSGMLAVIIRLQKHKNLLRTLQWQELKHRKNWKQ